MDELDPIRLFGRVAGYHGIALADPPAVAYGLAAAELYYPGHGPDRTHRWWIPAHDTEIESELEEWDDLSQTWVTTRPARHARVHGAYGESLDPRKVYALHNMVLKAVGEYAIISRAHVPADAQCQARAAGGVRCSRLRIPGFDVDHWHGASVTPDREILQTMLAELDLNESDD